MGDHGARTAGRIQWSFGSYRAGGTQQGGSNSNSIQPLADQWQILVGKSKDWQHDDKPRAGFSPWGGVRIVVSYLQHQFKKILTTISQEHLIISQYLYIYKEIIIPSYPMRTIVFDLQTFPTEVQSLVALGGADIWIDGRGTPKSGIQYSIIYNDIYDMYIYIHTIHIYLYLQTLYASCIYYCV